MVINHDNIEQMLTAELVAEWQITNGAELEAFCDYLSQNRWSFEGIAFRGTGIASRTKAIIAERIGCSTKPKAASRPWVGRQRKSPRS